MQNRGAIGVEMLLNKQESLTVVYLNVSNNLDVVVDEVSSFGSSLFFVALVSGIMSQSHVLYVLSSLQ